MISKERLIAVIAAYKKYFPVHWADESYKWKAILHFQKNWDLSASDFAKMFERATEKTANLLASGYFYPRAMIINFAKADPEVTREMFRKLYDESESLENRVNQFQVDAQYLKTEYDDGSWKNHYQNTNAISTYLWLRYPNKYYIYKYSDCLAVAQALKSEFVPKRSSSATMMMGGFALYDEICSYLQKEIELEKMLKSSITDSCYEDQAMKTMTMDFGFFICRFYHRETKKDVVEWFPPNISPKRCKKYTKKEFLQEVYISEEDFKSLSGILKRKKNLILQGAPGVGKTFTARRLAYVMMGEKDYSRVELIQFHQNYSYEDFIMGYKPDGEGFCLVNGIFYEFCKNAESHPNKDYFFIIDEVNRGNISKIFGELLMLIEKEYRGSQVVLPYSGRAFAVPENLYLIGMMNTADRGIAMMDYALRRRFSFYEMKPAFDSEGFQKYQGRLADKTFDLLIERVKELNREIVKDASLGTGFQIGHSYFCGQKECTKEWMKEVVSYDILPMLREYWFDDPRKVGYWEERLTEVFSFEDGK